MPSTVGTPFVVKQDLPVPPSTRPAALRAVLVAWMP
jgi:hypothetical protein